MTCTVEGCERATRCRGMCNKHYQRWWKHGDPITVLPMGPKCPAHQIGEQHGGWHGDAVTYSGLHQRLRKARGSASAHPCVDCNGPATQWSFDGTNGFSTDLTRYQPRCTSCHGHHDRTRSTV